MRNIWVLFLKDVRIFLRDRPAVILTFAVPAVLILIFGTIYSNDGGSGVGSVNLLVVDEARTAESKRLVEAIRDEELFDVTTDTAADGEAPAVPLTRADARAMLTEQASTWRHALILPPDLLGGGEFGFRIELLQDPLNTFETQMVEGLLQKLLMTEGMPILFDHFTTATDAERGPGTVARFHDDLAASISSHFGVPYEDVRARLDVSQPGSAAAGEGGEGEGAGFLEGLLRIEREQIRGQGKNPQVQNVGGWAVMFLLFSLTAAAASLIVEKREGLFLRLLSGAVTREQVLWSKYLFVVTMGVVQLGVLLLFGHLIYGIVTDASQLLPLFVICLSASLASASFGMILAAFCKTEAQLNGLSTLLILSMSALGGAMFPAFMLPGFIRDFVSPLTLVYWAQDGFQAVLWRDAGQLAVMRQAGVLLAIAAVVLPISVWRFRKGDLFR